MLTSSKFDVRATTSLVNSYDPIMITFPSEMTEELSDKIEDDINAEASKEEDGEERERNNFHKWVRPLPCNREYPSNPDHVQRGH